VRWRVILTDSESFTGVAPECPMVPQVHAKGWVYDCCPGPQLELWSEARAAQVAQLLTEMEAEVAG
jgi:hypothetical protein